MGTATRTFELSEEAAAELDRRALAANCDAAEVLDFLLRDDEIRSEDFTPEQWKMIRQGETEADAGSFATEEQVNALPGRRRSAA